MSTGKEQVRELAHSLPDDATWELVQYEIYVRARIAEGEKAAAEGRTLSHEEVVLRIATR